MEKELLDLNEKIKEEENAVKQVQKEIMQKRATLTKLKSKKETKSTENKQEITIENFTNFDLSTLGEDTVQTLYKQKEKNDFLKIQLEKLNKDRETFKKTSMIKPVDKSKIDKNEISYKTAPKRKKISQKLEETHRKIAEIDIKIKSKQREILETQRKLEKISENTINIDSPEASELVTEIGRIQEKIRAKETSIYELKNEYNIMNELELPEEDKNTIKQSEIDDLYYEVQEIKGELEEKETTIKQCIKEQEAATSLIEKRREYFVLLNKLKKKNPKLDEDSLINVDVLRKKLDELNSRKCESVEVTNTALIRQKKENKKAENYVQKQKEMLAIGMQQLTKTTAIIKHKIELCKVNGFNNEQMYITKLEKLEKKNAKI